MREPPLNLRALPARPRARCEFGEFISASPEAVCALFAVACIRSSQAFLLALGLYKLTNSHPPELSKGRAAGGGEGMPYGIVGIVVVVILVIILLSLLGFL